MGSILWYIKHQPTGERVEIDKFGRVDAGTILRGQSAMLGSAAMCLLVSSTVQQIGVILAVWVGLWKRSYYHQLGKPRSYIGTQVEIVG